MSCFISVAGCRKSAPAPTTLAAIPGAFCPSGGTFHMCIRESEEPRVRYHPSPPFGISSLSGPRAVEAGMGTRCVSCTCPASCSPEDSAHRVELPWRGCGKDVPPGEQEGSDLNKGWDVSKAWQCSTQSPGHRSEPLSSYTQSQSHFPPQQTQRPAPELQYVHLFSTVQPFPWSQEQGAFACASLPMVSQEVRPSAAARAAKRKVFFIGCLLGKCQGPVPRLAYSSVS